MAAALDKFGSAGAPAAALAAAALAAGSLYCCTTGRGSPAVAEPALPASAPAAEGYSYTIRPMHKADHPDGAAEQLAIKDMYLSNYDVYARYPCGVGECKCADLGKGMKRYTERFCGDMDVSRAHVACSCHRCDLRNAAAAATAAGSPGCHPRLSCANGGPLRLRRIWLRVT